MRSLLFVLMSAPLAMAQQPAAPQRGPQQPMTFFVTSQGSGKGADLGGLKGADARCQTLAAAVGAGNKTWHAYLSTQAADGQPAVNARDRIGAGPWYNSKGARIAKGLDDLHGDTLELARIGSSLTRITALTEKGDMIAGPPDDNQRHDILTGSQTDGRAFTEAADHTCRNWTSSTDGSAQIGHPDHTGGPNTSWNSAHASRGCSQESLKTMGGAGLFYCFAID
ncbi:MAG TPA: hypothetical protein VHY84_00685 [Bryobacteraceae bacterium]|nr:hypothetical protein [Bryobacteraceae bacterium]